MAAPPLRVFSEDFVLHLRNLWGNFCQICVFFALRLDLDDSMDPQAQNKIAQNQGDGVDGKPSLSQSPSRSTDTVSSTRSRPEVLEVWFSLYLPANSSLPVSASHCKMVVSQQHSLPLGILGSYCKQELQDRVSCWSWATRTAEPLLAQQERTLAQQLMDRDRLPGDTNM